MTYSYDAEGKEPMQERGELLPPDWYGMKIDAVDYKETKNGEGHYIELEWLVIEGPFANRRHWTRLNVDNPNAQAVEIAERELTSICQATGVLRFKDPRELQGTRALVKIGHKKRKDKDESEQMAYGYKPYVPVTMAPRPTVTRAAKRAPQQVPARSDEQMDNDDLPF